MFSKKNPPASKTDKPVTTSKGSTPTSAREEKASEPKPAAVKTAAVAVTPPVKPVVIAAAPATPVAPVATAAAPAAAKAEGTRDRSAVTSLIAKLRDPDADTARDAATTLGNLAPDAEAITALAAVLQNRDGYFHCVVRAAAAEALGKLGDRRAVDALIETTRDTMAEASQRAIHALGVLGDPRALPALQAIIRNEHGFFLDHIRKTAEESIAAINKASKAAKA